MQLQHTSDSVSVQDHMLGGNSAVGVTFCCGSPLSGKIQRENKYWCVLTAFVDVCRNLDGTGGVVDLVFKIGIVYKLQLQRRRGLQRVLLLSILCLWTHTNMRTHTHKSMWALKSKHLDWKLGKHANIALHSVAFHSVALHFPFVAQCIVSLCDSRIKSRHIWIIVSKEIPIITHFFSLSLDCSASTLSLSHENNSRYESRR